MTLEGLKHDFPFINICKVPREALKTEGVARGFRPTRWTLRMLMNDEIMFDRYYCINTSAPRYYWTCINENKNRVLIRDARGVNTRLLLMFATRHYAKHVLNYECLTSARIMHSVLA